MKRGKFVALAVIVPLLSVVIGYSARGDHVLVDVPDTAKLDCNFRIWNLRKIDETLKKQRYAYTTTIGKAYIAAVIYNGHSAALKQSLLRSGETKELTVSKDAKLVLSFPASSTVAFTWNLKKEDHPEILRMERSSRIAVFHREKVNVTGGDYGRQNFYFRPLKTGTDQLTFRYEPQTADVPVDSEVNILQFTFRINVRE